MDAAAPGLLVAQAIGRIGNYHADREGLAVAERRASTRARLPARRVGIDVFRGPGGDWRVYARNASGWQLTGLGGSSPDWNEQGSLYTLNKQLWSPDLARDSRWQ